MILLNKSKSEKTSMFVFENHPAVAYFNCFSIHFPEHMALKIERSHHFKTDDLRARLEQIRLELHDDLGIEAEWKGDIIHFHKLGVTGNVTYTPDRVQIVAKIPFFVPLSEKTLREEIEKRLDHYLRPPEADAA